jgi:hypothetical protein
VSRNIEPCNCGRSNCEYYDSANDNSYSKEELFSLLKSLNDQTQELEKLLYPTHTFATCWLDGVENHFKECYGC